MHDGDYESENYDKREKGKPISQRDSLPALGK
jgi:hypothetical protein